MNREIKFKAKRKDNNKWCFGQVVFDKEKRTFIVEEVEVYNCDENDDLYGIKWYEVIPETVSQYTGLDDTNGRKIFENDIVFYSDFASVYKDDITGVIKYTQDCMFEIEYDDKYVRGGKTTRPLVCHEHPIFTSKKIRIIGNKFDEENE